MADTRTGNSIKNSVTTIVGRLATNLMEFVLRTVLIKTLGIEYGGVSSLFVDILQILSLMELGFGNAIIFALYKPLAENDYKKINTLMRFYRNVYNLIAIVVFILGLCCIPFLDKIVTNVPNIKEDIRMVFMLYLAASSCSYLVAYKETLIRASQQSRIAVRIDMLVQLIFMGLESVGLFIFKEYFIYLFLRIISVLTRNLFISREVKNRFPKVDFRCKDKLDGSEKKKLMNDVSAMAMYKVSGVVLNSTDSIIISAFLGTGIVGIVGNYRMISNFVSNMCNKVWESVLPSIGNLATLQGSKKQYSVFKKITLGSFIFSSFCSVSLFVLMNPLVTVWLGTEYTISIIISIAIAFNSYLILTILPFQTFRDANGLFVQGKYRPLIMSAINIVLSLLLIKPWGVFGVLIATPISRIVTQTWFDPYIVYKHVFNRKPTEYYKDLLIHLLISVIIGAIIWFLLQIAPIGMGIGRLFVGGILCILVHILVYSLLFYRNDQFRELIKYFKMLYRKAIKHKE